MNDPVVALMCHGCVPRTPLPPATGTFYRGPTIGPNFPGAGSDKQLSVLFDVSWFCYGLLWALMAFNHSKMVNLGFRMDCKTLWNNFGTFKMSTKYGPSDPVFLTGVLTVLLCVDTGIYFPKMENRCTKIKNKHGEHNNKIRKWEATITKYRSQNEI